MYFQKSGHNRMAPCISKYPPAKPGHYEVSRSKRLVGDTGAAPTSGPPEGGAGTRGSADPAVIPLLSLPDIRPNRIFIPTDGRHTISPCSEVLSGEVPLLLPGHSSHVDGTLDFDLGQRTRRSWIDLWCAWRLTKASVTMDRRIRQTFTVSPA